MPPLKPGHVSPTPEEAAAIQAAIASDPDTREIIGSLVPITEADPELLAAYRAGKLTLPLHVREDWLSKHLTTPLNVDDIQAHLGASCSGWQTRANVAVREVVGSW